MTETYKLTPAGLIGASTCALLIAHMRRTGSDAIVIEDGRLRFITLDKDDGN